MRSQKLATVIVGSALCAAVVLFSCSKSGNNDTTPPPTGGGNSGGDTVLVNLGTNVILPAYQQLGTGTAALDAAITAFNAAPTATTLTAAQNAFKTAYKNWAAISEFEFGPAADLFLTTHFTNSFPTDTALIKSNTAGATYAIDGLANYAAQGFPAIDYLLFGNGNDAVLARFTTSANAAGAKQYLAALSGSIKTKAAAVATAWSPAGGNYLARFTKATGVDAGSSLSLLLNAYVLDFDVNLQNYKVGIPIGLYGPSMLPKAPTKVEGYYSGLSDQLLIAQAQAYQKIYLAGLNAKVAATKAQNNGASLNDVITNQLTTLITKFQALPEPLSTGVSNNASSINDAYTEIRKMTVLLKVDMSSALGIKISFQDDDGD
ncbi:imelysin family protein [Deminuibacter soli]|uniref:Imelysin-like domain-containing protein n=1 Tax=Deminuibacter soli TaxID=2291815 RepID=A0A3E1NCT4_9BACT|nr:imelysin family protein [Deminuibacter soli]RFM25819.1 hypothetical protein DXN05_22935 [Deminuibacter soli]